MSPIAIVTRPAAQAIGWAAQLQAEGVRAVSLPLIEIVAPADPGAVAAARRRLGDQRLVFFVSPTAVERFFAVGRGVDPAARVGLAATPATAIARTGAGTGDGTAGIRAGTAAVDGAGTWPSGTLAAASGPGTARALRQAGVPSVAIVEPPADAAQFDSEALWSALVSRFGEGAWRGAPVLVVRGDGGRDWLAGRLQAAGAQVAAVEAYRRAAPATAPGSAADRLLAEVAADPVSHCWVFSSSQAIDHLQALRPALPWAALRAVATHPRIGERAAAAGIGRVVASRPTVAAVAQSVHSLQSPAQ